MPGLTAGPRQTLQSPTELLEGVGLHSGLPAAVRISPAAAHTGIVFHDLESGRRIAALPENAEETARCTVLQAGGAAIQTVEHLLSALSGVGVDDAVIESRGGEMPALDGSAFPFVNALLLAGIRPLEGSARRVAAILRPAMLTGENGACIVVLPAPAFQATVVLDYPDHSYIGTQVATFDAAAGYYAEEIAPARTYGFRSEAAALQKLGLALGASKDNAVVLGEDRFESDLRFDNELARHKLLDLIGDLSLMGCPLQAHVLAVKPSHALNVRMAKMLAENTPQVT